MNRFEFYGPRDTRDTPNGDQAFIGIDMTSDKPLLQAGMFSFGQNTRCRNGRVKQRAGTQIPGDFNLPTGFANYLVGSGVFRNPNGAEVLLIAPANVSYAWAFEYGKDPVQINYDNSPAPTGTNGLVNVEFVQSFDKVQMLRRGVIGAEPLVWDGTNAGVWEVTTLTGAGTLIPLRTNGEPFMDRVIYYNALWPVVPGRDEWLISDIGDYSSYNSTYQTFRTNSAESDFITRILSYYKSSVIIFKNQSIHLRTIFDTIPMQTQERIVSRSMGSVGIKMPLMIGREVIFLSQPNGFYKLSQSDTDNIVTQPIPISERIQKIIDQINWPVTSAIGCSQAIGPYAFFGVAVGATPRGLNMLLVYDTQREQWESAGDTWNDPTFSFWALHLTNYAGVQRLFAVDYPNAVVYLLYEGVNDEMLTGEFHIPFKFETRGYIGTDGISFKKFGRALVGISTYDPRITVTAITDGFNEEKVLTPVPITKDRTRFYQHGKSDFDVNIDDANEQKREDYSIVSIDNFAAEDFEELAVGPIFRIPGTSPAVAGDQQETLEPLLVRSFGRWCALRIENESGVCEVTSVGVESVPAMNTGRTAA